MEIYREAVNRVYFDAPSESTVVTAQASYNDGSPVELVVGAEADSGIRSAELPYVSNEGTVIVEWRFEANTFEGTREVTVRDTYEVVTQILSNVEIKDIHPDVTPKELILIEKAVRHIINAYTGQTFGRYEGTHEVKGNDSLALRLPNRLVELHSVNGNPDTDKYFHLIDGGETLLHFPWGVPPVKADYYGLHQINGVIHNPNNVRLGEFYASMRYKIDGLWGWEEVPAQVREAAKLLINDYACAENTYRDRFLTSMTAADWRIQLNSLAWTGTGNARADELLQDYRVFSGWVA